MKNDRGPGEPLRLHSRGCLGIPIMCNFIACSGRHRRESTERSSIPRQWLNGCRQESLALPVKLGEAEIPG
jgi:hypothetical protein